MPADLPRLQFPERPVEDIIIWAGSKSPTPVQQDGGLWRRVEPTPALRLFARDYGTPFGMIVLGCFTANTFDCASVRALCSLASARS